jgi:hypothetical protein
MNILYMHPTGPMVRVDSDYLLHVESLNPEVKTRWRMSRWELFGLGWNMMMAAIFRPDPN